MIRAAAKNHDGGRGRRQAGELRRGARGAAASPAARSRPRRGTGSRTRRSPTPPPTTRRSRAGSGCATRPSPSHWVMAYEKFLELSYGENPHQKAALYVEHGARRTCSQGVAKLHGKALSFNNVLDLDSARRLLDEFEEPACVIVKHNNPCGAAIAETALRGLREGVRLRPAVGVRRRDRLQPAGRRGARRAPARAVHRGPAGARVRGGRARGPDAEGGDPDPRGRGQRLRAARARPEAGPRRAPGPGPRPDRGDARLDDGGDEAQPSEEQWDDLLFAWKVCRHVRSNAIVFAKDGATVGIGAGQMSRVDSVRIAIEKARRRVRRRAPARCSPARWSPRTRSSRSPTARRAAIDAGATALIQPGGSKRDGEVVAACDEAGVAMVFTGRRHFRH